jgi:hypothetical protein
MITRAEMNPAAAVDADKATVVEQHAEAILPLGPSY